ncbi:hypothetical protein C518_4506, partial [Lysinibacillus fusiformis ZB2]
QMGMDPRVIVGCQDMPIHAIIDLGFVFPTLDKRLVI